MPDLTFTQLQSRLPANSIVSASGDVTISLRAVMGETTVALTDQKVAEALSKLLEAANRAQDDYNANPSNAQDLRSYPAPSSGAPVRDSSGIWYSVFNYTLSVRMNINRDFVDAIADPAL
ncbi:MAG: hypothetical protein MUF72_10100 [Elainella sp. Prado103]|jgi:ABC-type nitrate/sulfonate/bicarbonate transport system substrate-binding protein|nr:hypothetical protein [Elainella sp. Prado103]